MSPVTAVNWQEVSRVSRKATSAICLCLLFFWREKVSRQQVSESNHKDLMVSYLSQLKALAQQINVGRSVTKFTRKVSRQLNLLSVTFAQIWCGASPGGSLSNTHNPP